MRAVAVSVVFSLVAIAVDAGAAVLYKLVDPLGQITFTDMIPEGFQGNVTRVVVDTESKTIPPERIPEVLARTPIDHESVVRLSPLTAEQRLKVAENRLADARSAYLEARDNSVATDWIYLGPNNPNGMRRMPRPEYQERLARLEQEAIAAENAYDALRRELR